MAIRPVQRKSGGVFGDAEFSHGWTSVMEVSARGIATSSTAGARMSEKLLDPTSGQENLRRDAEELAIRQPYMLDPDVVEARELYEMGDARLGKHVRDDG